MSEKLTKEEQHYADHAAKHLHRDGELEFDDVPKVSISEDGGAYVQAWVWIDQEDVEAFAMESHYFERFSVDMPRHAALECSHQGACDENVTYWTPKIPISAHDGTPATPDQIRAELEEYGAWDDSELTDDAQNRQRIVWIAAGHIHEQLREEENS